MRINTNISALTASYHLNLSDKKQSTSTAKLSSGNKLINIQDNPVGTAISSKLRSQIRNLDRAAQNSSDGISVIQTAEGALAEVQSMVHRMRELAVQGATDTATDEDRKSIQDEIDQLRTEIDRVAEDTDFNTKTLLDGSISRQTYTNNSNAEVTYVNENVDTGLYNLYYSNPATQGQVTTSSVTATDLVDGTMNLNGAMIEVSQGDTLTEFYNKLREAGDKTGIDVTYTGSLTGSAAFVFTTNRYGSAAEIDLTVGEDLAAATGLSEALYDNGTDATFVRDASGDLKESATITVDGNKATIKDINGFEMVVEMEDGLTVVGEQRIICGVRDEGSMTIQIGANEDQEIEIDIPEVSSKLLGLDNILAYTSSGSSKAITMCDDAIARISEIRSKIGSYENRMEHTISSLEVTEESVTAALSRISDVDMAEEMTNYTTLNVITQAATSMLSQANQQPEKVLQLLQ